MLGNWVSSFDTGLFDEFRLLEEEMEKVFGELNRTTGIRAVRKGAFPQVNVGATPERVDVYLFGAGLDPKSMDMSIQHNLLAVSGSRKLPVNKKAEYYRKERFDGDFRRVVTLPDDVDADRAEAKYMDGVLHVTIPRRESARPRQIEVK